MENNRQTCADYVSMFKVLIGRPRNPMTEENGMTPIYENDSVLCKKSM